MERIKRWFLLGGLLLSGLGALAQTAPGSRAQVWSISAGNFTVPQVTLPNAAVARRINRALIRWLAEYGETVDSTASARQQLRQAALACCYDKEEKQWMAGGMGHSGTNYKVLLNQGYLLSFEFYEDYNGLEDLKANHLNFDLRTGRVLTLADVVADPLAQLDRRLKDGLAQVATTYGDSSIIAHVATLYGLSGWNTPSAPVATGDAAADESVTLVDLRDFALRPHALLLFHSVEMSRYDAEFMLDDTYAFPFERLHPRGLLLTLVKVRQSKKR